MLNLSGFCIYILGAPRPPKAYKRASGRLWDMPGASSCLKRVMLALPLYSASHLRCAGQSGSGKSEAVTAVAETFLGVDGLWAVEQQTTGWRVRGSSASPASAVRKEVLPWDD